MNRRRPSSSSDPPRKAGRDKAMKDLATAAAAAAAAMDEDGDEEDKGVAVEEDEKKRRLTSSSSSFAAAKRGSGGSSGGGGSSSQLCCQAENCTADLTEAKRYHRRHKVCETHSKAAAVIVAGLRQRFCQQCSRFHELPEFDDTKRSCRRRLAGHNERRRKSSADAQGEESSSCRPADREGRAQISLPGSSAFKHFQIG